MRRYIAAASIVLLLVIGWGTKPVEASCTNASVKVLVPSVAVVGSIPLMGAVRVAWAIEPACDVIETGLLLGRDLASMELVGQAVYGLREVYWQDITVPKSGKYNVAAYARDEAGGIIQSPPSSIQIWVINNSPATGTDPQLLPLYTGTDADFLKPAGNPHFASLSGTTLTASTVLSKNGIPINALGQRHAGSPHKSDVRTQMQAGVDFGGLMIPPDPMQLDQVLSTWDATFASFPRTGFYSVACLADGLLSRPPLFATCLPVDPVMVFSLRFSEFASPFGQFSEVTSGRSSFAYFIPTAPPGQQVTSARLSLLISGAGGLSAVRLSGNSPASLTPLGCDFSVPPFCDVLAIWDFTDTVRTISAQGGGVLPLTVDQIPPIFGGTTSISFWTFRPAVNYPWQHGGPENALMITFGVPCTKELKLFVTPSSIPPRLPGQSQPPSATAEASVNNCPSGVSSPVEVHFRVVAPNPSTVEDGGHLHDGARHTGTFLQPFDLNKPTETTCIAVLDTHGRGSCTVTYQASNVGGIETIVASAGGFSNSQAKVRVEVPGLINLGDVRPKPGMSLPFRLDGQTETHEDNHWGTANTVGNIQLVAQDILNLYGAPLGINDMSLRQGGLFDICATWNPSDRCPPRAPLGGHILHRTGTSVDIDQRACDPNTQNRCIPTVPVNRRVIERRCVFHGGVLLPEATYHCEWPK